MFSVIDERMCPNARSDVEIQCPAYTFIWALKFRLTSSVTPSSLIWRPLQTSRLHSRFLTLWTPGAGIPVLRKLQNGARNRYTGHAQICLWRQKPVYRVCVNFQTAPDPGIPGLFSNVYWHFNSRVIEIQTRQQLKNNYFHETQRIFMHKFCIWTPSGQRTS